jgi:hypothetical protein
MHKKALRALSTSTGILFSETGVTVTPVVDPHSKHSIGTPINHLINLPRFSVAAIPRDKAWNAPDPLVFLKKALVSFVSKT